MVTALFLLREGRVERVAPDAPVLRADDLGVLRGESVFETMRIRRGRPALLAEHLTRLAQSAERVDIALPDGWAELAETASAGVDDGVLRLVSTKGGVSFALVTDVPAETVAGRSGVSAVTLTLGVTAAQRREAPWLLGGVKSTSYGVNMASLREAHAQGADDAIWLSSDGWVLEAPTSTVVVVLGDRLVTPPAATGILAGTTVAHCATLVPIETAPVSAADLAAADEVMLLSSVRGVAPVVRLDGRELGTGPRTKELAELCEASLSAE